MLSQKVAILTYFFVLISCSKYSSRDKTTTHKQLLQKQNNNSKHSLTVSYLNLEIIIKGFFV